MDFNNLYFFSTELSAPGLPVACKVVRRARTQQGHDAILIRCERKIAPYKINEIFLIQKHVGFDFDSLLTEQPVFVYVIDPRKLDISDSVDVSHVQDAILDWGGVCSKYETACSWQVSTDTAKQSDGQ